MALLKDYYNDQFDMAISNCYWKIELENGISGGKEKIKVRMGCYKNKETADTNQNKYADFDFEFVPILESHVGPRTLLNFIAQAYLHAKTLPEFAGAIDA